MKYDYLIVGAGLYGAVFAHEMTRRGKRCLVIDRRNHIAGNIYCYEQSGIRVHQYGPHIFHTSNRKVWNYINQFAEFNQYINSPIAIYNDELYNLPFNMNTFSKLWGVRTPKEAQEKIQEQIMQLGITKPQNLEEQALSMVGTDIYIKLVKGYTEKQWGRDCTVLPTFIIKRLPVRFTYDNNYFNDRWQGIPIGGYNPIIEKLLVGSDVQLCTDYFALQQKMSRLANCTLFTGMIDAFYDYRFGTLAYRTVRFETEELSVSNYQGNAVVNYTSPKVPYTRIIEHKHFEFGEQPTTIISREYSAEWKPGILPCYPINDAENTALYNKYNVLATQEENIIFGGRLGDYRYYNMDETIAAALNAVERQL